MKMLMITSFTLLNVIYLAAASVQHPHLTKCPGTEKTILQFTDITVKNAKVGQEVQFIIQFDLAQTSGTDPVLLTYFSTPSGRTLDCANLVLPRELKICNGNTPMEKELNAEWNNTCPVEAGKYTARLAVRIPDNALNMQCIGDGHLIITFEVMNQGKVMECVHFPITVQLD
ncbi:hypothetical protein HPB50_015553 [Hyalomma asiaticum]|uniref:Uncharacterized protein n=1 Tax=Hyalomma asiaticum TaxID=266040 RepID=A0ACB7SVK8_HYAAI|nr:hypothetical protein HPB50_015553 [Hyalomma asiaticum]